MKKIIFLLGPTGIGKSAVAISLAKKINAEIISCDSMQIYRCMDILTSKVTPDERKKIKHHLLGVIKPVQEYNVARYRADALAICEKLFKKNKVPLFVGGTGLYYSIIVDGLFPAVPKDKIIRKKLETQLAAKGSKYLYARLLRLDPAAAGKIHPHDARRIIRALEVYLKTGQPISDLQKTRIGLGNEYQLKILGLNAKRADLYARINTRVDGMFTRGLIREVKRLLTLSLSQTAKCAIGIRELAGYFAKEYSLQEARRLMQRNSRHYAKRQLTWFRKDKRIQWVQINKTDKPQKVALKLWKKLS